MYYGFNKQNSSYEIYDESHQYLKAITLDTLIYRKFIQYLSRNLFDTDSKSEFIALFNPDNENAFAILNEDGEEILSRPKYHGWVIYPVPGNARAIEHYNEPGQPVTSRVYKLPGQFGLLTGEKGEKGDKGDMPAHEWSGTMLRFEKPDGSWGEFVDLQGADGQAPLHEWNGSELRFQNPDGSWGAYTDLIGPQGEKGVCDCEQENGKVTNTRANVIKDAIISNPIPNPSNTHTFITYHLPQLPVSWLCSIQQVD